MDAYRKLQNLAQKLPRDLAIWKFGQSSLHALLLSIAVRYMKELLQSQKGGETEFDPSGRQYANATARLIEWSYQYGDQSSSGTPDIKSVEEAVNLALDWEVVEIGIQGGRAGRVQVDEDKEGLYIEPASHASIEVLDMVLEQIDTLNPEESRIGPSLEPAHSFFASQQGVLHVHKRLPPWIGGLYVQHMKNYSAQHLWEIPGDADLGGLKVRDAVPLIGTIKGMSLLQLTLFRGEPLPNTAYLSMSPETLRRYLNRYNPGNDAIDRFIEMVTYTGPGGKTPFSAPVVPWGDKVIIPFPLLSEGLEERMILRAAASNPATSGALGGALGKVGRRWGDRLTESIPGARVANEVKVLAPNRRKIGDLDVVVLDADRKSGLIVEVKWPIDARNLSEAWKQEDAIDKGRSQVLRLQKEIREGATVKLPPNWPPFDQVNWQWIVGTARYLDPRITDSEIASTSLRLVEQLLPVSTTRELLHKIKHFPYPQEGQEFTLGWKRIRVGGQNIRCRLIEMIEPLPVPPSDRKRSKGWT
ncbi:hypothetical protein ACF07M_00750 [Streptomyces globisporus]|uniref:hypothetical protein n=1 Tax=Streptomyces globisporus TaxID=1908 RepID=UPI003702FA35